MGQSKSLEDTEKYANRCLGIVPKEGEGDEGTPKSFRILYAVHEVLSPSSATNSVDNKENGRPTASSPSRFIGIINVRSLGGSHDLVLPPAYVDPTTINPSTLLLEFGYQFLPTSWSKGYATESVDAVLNALERAGRSTTGEPSFWLPYEKLYIRAIVNEENPASMRVMEKVGMQSLGTWEWTGEAVWLAGRWIEKSRIAIYGKYLIK